MIDRKNPIIESLCEIGLIEVRSDVVRDYEEYTKLPKEEYPKDLFNEILDSFLDLMGSSDKLSMGAACAMFCMFGEDEDTPPDEEHNKIMRAALGHAIITGQYVQKPEQISPDKTYVWMGKASVVRLRSRFLHNNVSERTKNVLKRLIDTIQYLHEVIERLEESDKWYSLNLTDDQMKQYQKDVLKYTDEDFGLQEEK